MRPWLKTAMRSLIVSASSWSWVTKQEGDADLALDRLELDLHLLAQLEVEGAERLVEQQHPRPVDQGAGQRDPLPLPAGELRRPPVAVPLEPDGLERLLGPLAALGRGDLLTRRPYSTLLSTSMCGNSA